MNHIDQRLLEMKLRLECSGAESAVVSAVWSSIEALDFGGLDAACLENYYRALDATDQIAWIGYGGSQLAAESERDVLSFQQAAFRLELVKRLDTEDEEVDYAVHSTVSKDDTEYHWKETVKEIVEVDGQFFEDEKVIDRVTVVPITASSVVTERRIKSAFDVAMSMKFGSDWDSQLKNPRGSQSSGTIKVFDGGLNEKNKPTFMSSSRQYGKTVISLRPVSVAKHPSVEIEVEKNGTVFKKEVLVHEPLENSIECGIMLKEEFEALKIISIPMSSKNMDLTADGRREIFMVGLVPYVRHRQCRCAGGWINVGGEAVNLAAWNACHGELSAYCSEASDWSVMEAWLADCPNPLESYYAWKFPSKDSKKLAINAMAGVSSSRLNKNGLAPKIYIPALDAMRQSQNCERFIQWNLDDQIRKLLGGRRNNSVENLVGDNDVSDYYDEIYDPESGLTYLEMARKNLAKSWVQSSKNANRELARNASKNVGKMYKSKSSKLRNGDKSCTVNGARSAVLTESTIWIQITAPGHELDQFAGIVDAAGMVEKFGELGFNFGGFAAEELEKGFTHGLNAKLTKDDLERMLKSYMIRLNDLSIESVYMDGDSPWLNIREHLFPEDVTVLARCINMEELERLQRARQLVEDCGMDTSDIKQILTAYRKPVQFRKMFFDGEVRNQTWAGLK